MTADMAKKRKTPPVSTTEHPLLTVVRDQLSKLGDFGHLLVVLRGDHIFIEQPGPPEDPDDTYPVLRLSSIGNFRFGLSLYLHTGRWQPVPISGTISDVLSEAIKIRGPLLERD
jgi:hypothetical protein